MDSFPLYLIQDGCQGLTAIDGNNKKLVKTADFDGKSIKIDNFDRKLIKNDDFDRNSAKIANFLAKSKKSLIFWSTKTPIMP